MKSHDRIIIIFINNYAKRSLIKNSSLSCNQSGGVLAKFLRHVCFQIILYLFDLKDA